MFACSNAQTITLNALRHNIFPLLNCFLEGWIIPQYINTGIFNITFDQLFYKVTFLQFSPPPTSHFSKPGQALLSWMLHVRKCKHHSVSSVICYRNAYPLELIGTQFWWSIKKRVYSLDIGSHVLWVPTCVKIHLRGLIGLMLLHELCLRACKAGFSVVSKSLLVWQLSRVH